MKVSESMNNCYLGNGGKVSLLKSHNELCYYRDAINLSGNRSSL